MADVFSKKKRSEIMSKIRSEETQIEQVAFKYLRKQGIYFQKHCKKAPGSPDIALPRKKIAVFIDGDFWHGWQFSKKRDKLPKKYWLKKIESNIQRDKKNRAKLRREGWKVLRVWEHQLKNQQKKYLKKILNLLQNDNNGIN